MSPTQVPANPSSAKQIEPKRAIASLTLTWLLIVSTLLVGIPLTPGITEDAHAVSSAFGQPGQARFDSYAATGSLGNSAGEPGIGANWVSGDYMMNDFQRQLRISFNDAVFPPAATWTPATSPFSVINIDPVLFTDPITGRTFAGGLDGACSVLSYSDDDGRLWLPMTDACALPGWDHPTVGAGPFAANMAIFGDASPLYPHAVYYCSQPGLSPGPAFCAISLDGGLSFVNTAPPWLTGTCRGLHGHLRVAPDGSAYLPNKNCSGDFGFSVTENNGLSWSVRRVPGTPGEGRFDPSIAPTYDSGWVYIGQAESDGAYIAMSKDKGLTWQDMGVGNGMPAGTKALNVGLLADPPVHEAEFADVIAGDDERAAFAFLGATKSGNHFGVDCNQETDYVWYMYAAMTYDAGVTWDVQRVSPDPVQRGQIGEPDSSCRNLLDFNDITVDKTGRVVIGYADGCTGACAGPSGTASQSRSDKATITRQTTGLGLFSAYDAGGSALSASTTGPYFGDVGTAIPMLGTGSGGTPPYSFAWEFGDGGVGSGAATTHSYAASGTYTVKLTVTDGASDSAVVYTTATASEQGATPFVDITKPLDGASVGGVSRIGGTAGVTNGTGGQPLAFAGLGSASASGTTATLSWGVATGGVGPYSYLVFQGPSGSVDLGTPTRETTSLGTTIAGLAAGVEVCFIVRAKDSSGATDTNTIERCVLPQITVETLKFYYHGGALVDAPDPAPVGAYMIRGDMGLTPGTAPKTALTGGPVGWIGNGATAAEAREAYPATFLTEPLTGDLTIAGGVQSHTGTSDPGPWDVAVGAKLRTCAALGLEGGFYAEVWEVRADGTVWRVFMHDGYDWAGTSVVADGPDGACVEHPLTYSDPVSSHTFAAGSRILVGLAPDIFLGSVGHELKWDGTGLYDSHLELTGSYDDTPTPIEPTGEAAGDALSTDTDFVGIGVQTTADDLVVTLSVAAFTGPAAPYNGPFTAGAFTYNLFFEHDGTSYEYEIYTIADFSGLWSYNAGGDSTGTLTWDYANDRVLVTIPWAELGAQPGDAIDDLYAWSYQALGIGVTHIRADDRVPDTDGLDLSVPSAVLGSTQDGLVLYLHDEQRRDVGIPMLGIQGTTPAGLRPESPESNGAIARPTSPAEALVARSAPADVGLALGDVATVSLYASTFEADLDATLVARLEKVTPSGVVVFGTSTHDLDGLGTAARKVTLGLTLPSDATLAPGESLQLVAWIDSQDSEATHWLWYDGARAPSLLQVPAVATSAVTGGEDSGTSGFRVINTDDPAELPGDYESMDLQNAYLESDGASLTLTFKLHGFDAAMPAPGLTDYFWKLSFDHGGRRMGAQIDAKGMTSPTFSGSATCAGCGGAAGWRTLAKDFPVTIDGTTIRTTLPLSAFTSAETGTLGPGDVLARMQLEANGLVPGNGAGGAFVLFDLAPGGGPEEYRPVTGGAIPDTRQYGNSYTIPDGTEPDTPPTIDAFSADVPSGNAPLTVTFSGHVTAGSSSVATLFVDFDDGSDPALVPLGTNGTFDVSHVFESSGPYTVRATATGTNGLSSSATVPITVGSLTPGVHVKVGNVPLVKAVDDSTAGDWSAWHLDFDFGVFAPDSTVQIRATYFDGTIESAPDTVSVVVLEGGNVRITNPIHGSYLDPGVTTVTGTTTDTAGTGGQGQGMQAGMWDLPFPDDLDSDRVMDALEDHLDTLGAGDLVDVKLLLDRPATQDDAEVLAALSGATYAYAIKVIDAVDLEGVPKHVLPTLLAHPGAVRLEWILPAIDHSNIAMQAAKARYSSTYATQCAWGGVTCLGYTGAGIGYANFDSGVRESHETFQWNAFAPQGAVPTDSKVVARFSPFSQVSNGDHATATAGLAVGTGGPSGQYTGSAPGAHLISVQATSIPDSNGLVSTRTCQAIDMMIANKAAYDIRVISISYGSVVPISSSDDTCVNRAVDAGIVVTIASGNTVGIGSPGTAAKAITVGNQDDMSTVPRNDDNVCHGAGYGRGGWISACGVSGSVAAATTTVGKPEIMAPGTTMYTASSATSSAYDVGSGTSWSAPLVAGVVATMLDANPNLTPAAVDEILTQTAHLGDLPPTGQWAPMVGYGFVDAYAAVAEAIARGGGSPLNVDVGGPYVTAPAVPITLGATVTGGTPPYTYLWNFGDLATSTEPSPSHAWANEGTYTVTMTVTDSLGAIDSDQTTVTVASTLTATITSPTTGAVLTGNVTVTGASFFPPTGTGKPFNKADPIWTDPEGDLAIAGTPQPEHEPLDIIAAYGWGDEGTADPDFNLGLGIKDVPPFPANLQYLRYNIEFRFVDKDYRVSTFIDPVNSVRQGGDGFTPVGLMYERNAGPTGGWTNGQPITVVWDDVEDVIKFTVPKSRVIDAAGNGLGTDAQISDFLASAATGVTAATQSATIASHDLSAPPAGFTLRLNPSGGDPHTLVTFGALPAVRVDGATWNVPVDTRLVLDGPATIRAVATDGLGSFSDPHMVLVTVSNGVDPGLPFVTVETPTAGAIVSGTIGFAGTAGVVAEGQGSQSSVTLTPGEGEGKVPYPFRMLVETSGPVSSHVVDWGDGEVQYGQGRPDDLFLHTYTVPGEHDVLVTVYDALGRPDTDGFTVITSSHPAGEPGPDRSTLYFHVAADPVSGAFTRYWSNALEADPADNTDGFGGSTGLSSDGADVWPLDPAPSQDLYLTPGGVGSGTLVYYGAADLGVTVGIDVLVDGVLRASGSTTGDFLAYQDNTLTFNVLVGSGWDGTIPAGSAVEVVTYYRTATGGWIGHIEYAFKDFRLTLPFATGPGGGGGGGNVESMFWYGHDLAASWTVCTGSVAGLKTEPPAGQPDVSSAFIACTAGSDITLLSGPLAEEVKISSSEASLVTTYVGTFPFTDVGVALPVTITARVGTASNPTLVGSTSVTVTPVHTGDVWPTPVVLSVKPPADVTVPAGQPLQVYLSYATAAAGTHPIPNSRAGGGEEHAYVLDLKTVGDVVVDPPAKVTGLVATPGDAQVSLSWDAVADANSYNVYMDNVFIESTGQTIYTRTGLTNGVAYTFEVSASSLEGLEGPRSTPATATPSDGTVVTERVDVSVRRVSDSVIVLPPTAASGIASWGLPWDTLPVDDGDYVVTAVYTDPSGRTADTSVSFSVDNVPDVVPPTVSLSGAPAQVRSGIDVTFVADATDGGGTLTYAWDFGDGTTIASGAATEIHAYAAPGVYTTSVTVTNAAGSASDAVETVVMDPRFVEVRFVSGSGASPWQAATATAEDGSFATWATTWDATGLVGAHTIEARFFDGFDMNGPALSTVTVDAAPAAVLVATPGAADMDDIVTLDGAGSSDPDGTIAEYRFDAGDGTGIQSTSSPSIGHHYVAQGVYTASLFVVDDLGRMAGPATATVTVANVPPVADIGAPAVASTVTPVLFEGHGSYDPDGTTLGFAWTFGDGNVSAEMDPEHVYARSATYTVTLTVTDSEGATDAATHLVEILNTPPRASLAVSPEDDLTLVERVFSGSASRDPDGTIVSYRFDAGDGSPPVVTTDDSVNHTYMRPGVFTATLVVVDDEGAESGVDPVSVIVRNRPVQLGAIGAQTVAEGDLLPISILAQDPEGTAVTITAEGVPAGATFVDNGNGTADFAWPTGFLDAGDHSVTFRAVDGDGDETSEVVPITVLNTDRPTLLASSGNTFVNVGTPISVSITATDPDTDDVVVLTASGLPSGATFVDNGDRTASLAWAADEHGVFPVTVGSDTGHGQSALLVTLSANAIPVPRITAPDWGRPDTAVTIKSTSADPDHPFGALTHAWTLGDGTTSTAATLSHTYAAGGSYVVTLTLTDPFGASATTSKTIRIDGDAPNASATVVGTPTDGHFLGPVAVRVSGADVPGPEASGLAYLLVYVDAAAPVRGNAGGTFTVTGDGAHTVSVRGVDVAGNVGAPSSVSFSIDTTAPVLAITSPSATMVGPLAAPPVVSGKVAVNGTSADATAGTAALRLYIDGALRESRSATDGTFAFEWDSASYPPGAHDIMVEAEDKLGHVSTKTVRVVSI